MPSDCEAGGFQLVAFDISASVYFHNVIHLFSADPHGNAFVGGCLDGKAEPLPFLSLRSLWAA